MQYHQELVQKAIKDKHSFIEIESGESSYYLNYKDFSLKDIYDRIDRYNLTETSKIGIVDIVSVGEDNIQTLVTSSVEAEIIRCSLIDKEDHIVNVGYSRNPIIEYIDLKKSKKVLVN